MSTVKFWKQQRSPLGLDFLSDSIYVCYFCPNYYVLLYMLCEAYDVGWDFFIAPEQQPHLTKIMQLRKLAKTLLDNVKLSLQNFALPFMVSTHSVFSNHSADDSNKISY